MNATWVSSRLAAIISLALFTVLLAGQSTYCFKRPMMSLDSLAYIALMDNGSQQSFRTAMDSCDEALPGPHTGCEEDREHYHVFPEVAAYSPADFDSFLRFYRVKPLYLAVLKVLHNGLGLPGYTALRALSSGSFALVGIMLLLWLRQHLSTPAACAVASLIACTQEVLALGKFLLPDAFMLALMLAVLYLILYRFQRLWPRLLLLAALPLARPDLLVFSLIYGGFLLFRATAGRRRLILRLVCLITFAVVENAALQRWTHAVSFTVLFNHSFLAWTPPSTYPNLRLSLHDYVHTVVAGGFKTIALDFPLPLLFTVLALASRRTWQPMRDLVAASAVTSFARLLLFPNMEARYYTWFLVLAALGAATTLAQSLEPGNWFTRPARASHIPDLR